MPQRPFRTTDAIKQPHPCLGTDAVAAGARGELVETLPAPGDVKPIQHGLGLRHGRALDRTETKVAISQDRHVRVRADAVVAQGLRHRLGSRPSARPQQGEPRHLHSASADLPGHDLERAGRPPMAIARAHTTDSGGRPRRVV
jgi:hypothetical protein